jgi:hypothetical protein
MALLSGDPQFDALLKEANAAFDKLSPDEKAAHRREQYISFVYGQLKLSGRNVTKESLAKAYDEMLAKGEIHG